MSTYVRRREQARATCGGRRLPSRCVVPVSTTHCRLEISDGDEPRTLDEQLELAASVGVVGVVQAGGDVESSVWSADAAAARPRVLAAVAIHPNEAPVYARPAGSTRPSP